MKHRLKNFDLTFLDKTEKSFNKYVLKNEAFMSCNFWRLQTCLIFQSSWLKYLLVPCSDWMGMVVQLCFGFTIDILITITTVLNYSEQYLGWVSRVLGTHRFQGKHFYPKDFKTLQYLWHEGFKGKYLGTLRIKFLFTPLISPYYWIIVFFILPDTILRFHVATWWQE